jgi:hypothetical protein
VLSGFPGGCGGGGGGGGGGSCLLVRGAALLDCVRGSGSGEAGFVLVGGGASMLVSSIIWTITASVFLDGLAFSLLGDAPRDEEEFFL